MSQSGTGPSGNQGTVYNLTAGNGIILTPNPITGSGVISLSTPVTIANGGTNQNTFTTNGTVYFDGTSLNSTLPGVTNYVLTSNGAGFGPSFKPVPSSSTSFVTDSGTAAPALNIIKLISGFSTFNSGSSVEFTGSGNTVLLNVTDANNNTIIGHSSGSVDPSFQQNVVLGSGVFAVGSQANKNVAIGYQACGNATFYDNCVAIGWQTMQSSTGVVEFCTAVGSQTLQECTGNNNTAIGFSSLGSVTSGTDNTGVGQSTCDNVSTGINNTAIGSGAGRTWSGGDSNNIAIGHAGVSGDSGIIRVGTSGTQTKCFISGITGSTISNSVAVLINSSTGQLGTLASSIRYKENVSNMSYSSSAIMSLRPVIFNLKSDETKSIQYGLIAEEVEQVFRDLVVYKDDQPETVKYLDLIPMLLNELQKLRKEFEDYKKERP